MGGLRDIVGMLLSAGADPEMQDWSGSSALDYAFDEVTFELIARVQFPSLAKRDRQALDWLSGVRGTGYDKGPHVSTPMLRALSGFRGAIEPPVPAPLTFTEAMARETWVTSIAIDRRVTSRVRIVLRIGADPDQRALWQGYDWTPLGVALVAKQYVPARLLLDYGANVNQRWCVNIDWNYFPAEGPTDPRCTIENGVTPLMWAAGEGDEQAVKLLLEYAADVTLRNWAGQSAADLARTDGIRRLLEARSSTATPPQSR
jgi:hypothetical protein